MAQSLYGLFEHAVGFALYQVKEFDEMALLAPRVEQGILDLGKFNSLVKTVAIFPFKNSQNALENMNSITEGVLPEDLKVFLENNLPKSTKKLKVTLGVSEPKLAASIADELDVSCTTSGAIPELMRGFRLHFSNMIKEGKITNAVSDKAQLSLGHSYSRAKVKFNVHRVDNMIIQSIALLDQLDKDINTFSMRIREWYSYHFPELVKIVPDNYMYARCIQVIQDRQQLSEEMSEPLEEIIMDSAKVQAIFDSAKSSMGMDISPLDLINVQECASRVIGLAEYRQKLAKYLVDKMKAVAPNLGALIGEQVAARLIAHAGSLTNLAKYPASTVQILGAEKALFRALKTRGNTPKYGLIYHSTFIGRAGQKNKGRISRYLANKCSIASRIDCFADFPTDVFGDQMRQQVEDRLKFYESGEAPPKNVDVMKQASVMAAERQAKLVKKEKKKKRKDKSQTEDGEETGGDTTMEAETPKKKKRKHQDADMDESVNGGDEGEGESKKKKKKKKAKEEEEEVNGDSTPSKKDKKKKKRQSQ